MQAEQTISLVSDIKKYDESFDLVSLLQEKLRILKLRDSVKDTFDGKLAFFLEKYYDDMYLEYGIWGGHKLYFEIRDETIVNELISFAKGNVFGTKEIGCSGRNPNDYKGIYYSIMLYPNNSNKFIEILKELDASSALKKIDKNTYTK